MGSNVFFEEHEIVPAPPSKVKCIWITFCQKQDDWTCRGGGKTFWSSAEHPWAILTSGLNSGQVSSHQGQCQGLKVTSVVVKTSNLKNHCSTDGDIWMAQCTVIGGKRKGQIIGETNLSIRRTSDIFRFTLLSPRKERVYSLHMKYLTYSILIFQ